MKLDEKLYHIIAGLRKEIKNLQIGIDTLSTIVDARNIQSGYACPNCGYNKGRIYTITSVKKDPKNRYRKRYATCKNCGTKILQQVINVKVLGR